MNFEKFLTTPFLQNTSGRLLLETRLKKPKKQLRGVLIKLQSTFQARPILESKSTRAILKKKGKRGQKRAKYLKIWTKMHKI